MPELFNQIEYMIALWSLPATYWILLNHAIDKAQENMGDGDVSAFNAAFYNLSRLQARRNRAAAHWPVVY